MFYEINNKYYVKMSNYYQEVEYIKNNIVPKKGEKSRIYNPNSAVREISYKDLLETFKKNNSRATTTKKDNLNIL